jgi:hypothetical protein
LPLPPLLAALLASLIAQAGVTLTPAPARPHIHALRIAEPPAIDGRLDDPAWRAAIPSDVFTQHFPDEGAPASERTAVRVLYDESALYVGIDCTQVLSPVVRRLVRRDSNVPSDSVWIDIDSRRDGVSAFHFGVNAAGVLSDAIHFNDTDFSSDWDAVWQAKVADTGHGYSVEIRIPLSVLRFSAAQLQDWGFEVRRFIEARQETDDWAFFPRTAANYVPNFGRLDNLVDLRSGRPLELRPFLLGRLRERAPDASTTTLAHGTDLSGSVGLDAKAHLTNELALDLTVNPDFGQVEADTVILNLSTYETFFPEKRPFFLEGIDTFAAARPLLYTRRIGRQPPAPALGIGEVLVDDLQPSQIYGAAKLVGTIGGRTTVGVLSAVTAENDALVDKGGGVRSLRLAEPMTTYNVVRLKRLVGPNSDVGFMATATNRLEPPVGADGCPTTLAAPVAADGRCFNDAYVASVDGRWRSPSGDYAVVGQALVSLLERGPPRPEPDGIPIQPGTPSGGGALYVGKQGGEHWLFGGWQYLSGRQLELNDLGYLDRKDDYQGYFTLTYRTLNPWWYTRETRTTLQLNVRETLDGINLWNAAELNTWWNLESFWSFYFEVHYRGAHFDDREMGDGAALERAGLIGIEGTLSSDPRRRVAGWVFGQAHRLTDGAHYEARGDLTIRVLPQLELDVIPTWTYDRGEPRFISNMNVFDPNTGLPLHYFFGAQEARSLGTTIRGAYTFTPELSLQVYAQLFLTRVHYPTFSEYNVAPGAHRERVHLADLMSISDPGLMADSRTSTLNVNVVGRWEYRLGSTLFLVYTRAQSPALPAAPATSFDVRPVLQGRAAVDVVMMKLAYWWG